MEIKLTEVSPEGVLLVDKEKGKTSFDAVRVIRRILNCKKTGHAGTLDPFATGLLVMLLGQGTKLSPYIMGEEKKYRAEIMLGIETDTCDPTGSIVSEAPFGGIGVKDIDEVAACFTGVIEQIPPAFSALKVNGERAYKLARKGIEVELKKREVTVHSIDIIDIRLPLITLDVRCSSGTYIRSLAADMGRALGTVAHLKNLRRLSSGSFDVDDAMGFNEPDSITGDVILSRIIPLHESLPAMKTANLDDQLADKVRKGYRPSWNELTANTDLPDICNGDVKLVNNSGLVAIVEIERSSTRENNWLKKIKVFN
ncbi:MAG: tRNA pseudouridine(55) synthase TruB [Deltaproteobacteria bacterium]|nr:tRNA pseudouridine(55) synthase TruB [Deltaproteobacteria bacterium]